MSRSLQLIYVIAFRLARSGIKISLFSVTFLLLISGNGSGTSLLVFPGAEGFGAITPAGRGGKIVKVTNLNDSGDGSLRQALYSTPGPRIVVFEVAGVINLNSVLVIREPYVTIAGQTAPAPGITLNRYGLRIYTHDVLVQHLFVRPNPTFATGGGDGIAIKVSAPDNPYNIVIDHCSISWANDENISVFPGYGNQTDQNVTISNCLVGEGHYGVLIGPNATRISFLRNVVLSTVERQPRIGGGTYAHVVNNLFYNTAGSNFSSVGSTWGEDRVDYVGNSFVVGPSTRSGATAIAATKIIQPGSKIYAPKSGAHANIASNSLTAPSVNSFLVTTPLVPMDFGIAVTPVAEIEKTLMRTVGARPAERNTQYADEVDKRFLHEVQTRTGAVKNRAIQVWTKPRATVRDIDPLLPANPNSDDNKNGYTNIDEFLYQMALKVEGR